MIKSDSLIIFYQIRIDELRGLLVNNKDPFFRNTIDLDISYFLQLINDRVSFLNKHQQQST